MSDLYYPLKVAGLTRQLPLCPISDETMIGAFVIFGDTELTMACARELNKLVPATGRSSASIATTPTT